MKIITNTAISLDGKINTRGRPLKNLGSENDLKRLLQIRNLADAILVGGNTFRQYPHASLSENLLKRKTKKPIWNIILSQTLDFDFNKKYLSESRIKRLCLTAKKNVPQNFPLPVLGNLKKITPDWIVKQLKNLGIKTLLVEGGGIIIAQFLKANLVDEMYVTLCPKIIGDNEAPSLVNQLDSVKKLKILKSEQIGSEIFFHYRAK